MKYHCNIERFYLMIRFTFAELIVEGWIVMKGNKYILLWILAVATVLSVGGLLSGCTPLSSPPLSETDTLGETVAATTPVTEATQPSEETQPEETQPEVTQPEVTQPEVTQPEETQPEVTQPEETQPEVTQPEETQPPENATTPEDESEEQATLPLLELETQEAVETEGEETLAEEQTEVSLIPPAEPAKVPVFSHQGGLYTSAFSLELTAPEGYTIRYTTDGSVPTNRSTVYRAPISVSGAAREGTTIRAACFGSDRKMAGAVITHTYVIVKSATGKLYTVMISVADSDLNAMMDDVTAKIEKPAHVEIVNPAGETVISQDAGLRLFGGSSRKLDQKSFKLIARKTGYFGDDVGYEGTGSFKYPLFPDRTIKGGIKVGSVLDRYDSIVLRNGGNDSLVNTWCNPEYSTLLRDGMANNFAARVTEHLEYSLSHFAVVYINGEYYGILDMRENLNEDFVKRVWGVDDNDVVVIKSELDTSRACPNHRSDGAACRYCGSWFFYETGDSALEQSTLQDWITFCKGIVNKVNASDAVYNTAYTQFTEQVDIESMIEWYALNLYLCNTDWPHNNIKLWKYTGQPVDGIEITDGKWRFMTRDMDMTMGRYARTDLTAELDTRADVDVFYRTLGNYLDYSRYYANEGPTQRYEDALYLQGIFAFCMRNDDFRHRFAAYCRELITAENQALLKSICNAMVTQVRSEIPAHITRWKDSLGNPDYTIADWNAARRSITDFLTARPAKFEEHLNRCLSMYQ